MTQKLYDELARDLRNQVIFDQMKRLNRRQNFEILVRRHAPAIPWIMLAAAWIIFITLIVFRFRHA